MKNLFSIDRTADADNVAFDRVPFPVAAVSDETRRRIEAAFAAPPERAPDRGPEERADRAKSRVSWILCGAFLLLSLLVYFPLSRLKASPFLALIPLLLLIVSLFFYLRAQKAERAALTREPAGCPDAEGFGQRVADASAAAAAELDIPRDAQRLDILPLYYRTAKGRTVSADKPGRFRNFGVSAFLRDGSLCLSTLLERFEIPLGAIVGYRRYDRPYTVDMWIKAEGSDAPAYARFRLSRSGFFGRRGRGYYGVEVRADGGGEGFEILLPGYDFPALQRLIDLKPLQDGEAEGD